MFIRATLHFKGPICNCEYGDLMWNVQADATNRASLVVMCNKCKVALIVPPDQFLANFKFDKDYPKGWKPKEDKKIPAEDKAPENTKPLTTELSDADKQFLKEQGLLP